MNKSRLDSRMSSMQCCMQIAKYLDDSPQHLIPIPLGSSESDIQEIDDKHRLWRKHIAHMLNAIELEIAIKVIWELDNQSDCRNTHNISELYDELKKESQRELKEIYDEKAEVLSGLQGTDRKSQRIRLSDLVEFQSLQDALLANEDTMKNFKYDGDFNGKSSAMGSIIWNNNRLYAIPPLNSERLPEALYHYTIGRLQRANLGQV